MAWISGGGGQGRRPGRDVKGVHYFGQTCSSRRFRPAQALRKIGKAKIAAAGITKRQSRQVDHLLGVLTDGSKNLSG